MSNKRKLYRIHKFDFDLLFKYGLLDLENGVLICNELNSEYAEKLNDKTFETDKKGDCQLFNQTRKALNIDKDEENIFEDIFVNIDFSTHIQNNSLSTNLRKIPNGIKLYVDKKQIHIVDFLKSNSMSKNCCVYYINKEYKEKIEPRVTFNLNKGNMILSKWYAYSGLSISDATILENVKLIEEEIVILPDSEVNTNVECITAVSVPLLLEKIDTIVKAINDLIKLDVDLTLSIKNYQKSIEKEKNIFYGHINKLLTLENEINSYYDSKDYERIKNEPTNKPKIQFNRENIIYILEKIHNFSSVSINELINITNLLKEEYRNFNKKEQEYLKEEYKINEIYWEKFHVKNYPISINKFDGEGLIEKEFARFINVQLNENGALFEDDEDDINELLSSIFGYDFENAANIKEKKGYSFQIRLPFIKGVVHSCNFRKFFKEKGISKIYGKTFDGSNLREYDVEKVKLILTESQFKASGFINNIERKEKESPLSAFFRIMNEYDYSFAISNLEPKHNNKVKLNYQFLTTIPFNKRDLDNILNENRIKFNLEVSNNKIADDLTMQNEDERKIYEANKEFYYSTSKFKKRQEKTIKDKKRDLLKIKLECPGYRKLICSDLLELLYYAAYHNSNEKYRLEFLKNYEFYAPNTEIDSNANETNHCILLRNPHYSRNEISVLKPMDETKENERIKYFKHLTGVIMVNPISLTAERLGGADYDGDTLVLLTNRYRGNTIKKLVNKDRRLRYPLIRIPSLQTDKVSYNYHHIVESFENTFSSRVGLISYDALHKSFDVYSNGKSDEEEIMPFYTILSGLEIDSAKKGIKPYLIETQKNKNAKLFLDFNKSLKSDKFNLKDYEESINELNNEHILFEVCKDIYDYDSKSKHKGISLTFSENIDKEDILKAISIFIVYDEIMSIKKGYRRYNNTIYSKNKLIRSILNNLNYLLHLKKYDNNEILTYFETNDPIETFKKYCESKEKYHFLTTKEDRIRFLEVTLNIKNLPLDILDTITNFDNKGLYLLYVILYYWAEIDKMKLAKYRENTYSEEKLNKEEDELVSTKHLNIENISKDDLDYIVNEINKLKELILEQVKGKNNNKSTYKEIENVEKVSIKLLKKKASSISADACISIIKNIKSSNIIFDVFSNHLVEILKREEALING